MCVQALYELDTSDKTKIQNKRIWGFPVNTTFKTLEALKKLVLQTKIHTVNR